MNTGILFSDQNDFYFEKILPSVETGLSRIEVSMYPQSVKAAEWMVNSDFKCGYIWLKRMHSYLDSLKPVFEVGLQEMVASYFEMVSGHHTLVAFY